MLKYPLGIGLGVGLLYLALRGVDFDRVKADFLEANYLWVAIALFVALLSHWFRAVRWKMLLRAAGYESKTMNLFSSLMVGYMVNQAIPRGGEVTRPTLTTKTEKIPLTVTLGTIVTDRIFDVIILGLLVGFVFISQFGRVNTIINEAFSSAPEPGAEEGGLPIFLIILAALAVIGILGIIIFRKKLMESGLWERGRAFVKEMFDAIKSVRKMDKPGWFVFHTIMIWVCYVMMTYLAFFALEKTSGLPFIFGLTAFTMGGIGMVIPSPGGIGSYHYAIAISFWAFADIMSMAPEEAKGLGLSIAFIIHTSQMLMMILVGFICYLYLIPQLRLSKSEEELEESNPEAVTETSS